MKHLILASSTLKVQPRWAYIVGFNRTTSVVTIAQADEDNTITDVPVEDSFFARGEPDLHDIFILYDHGLIRWLTKDEMDESFTDGPMIDLENPNMSEDLESGD